MPASRCLLRVSRHDVRHSTRTSISAFDLLLKLSLVGTPVHRYELLREKVLLKDENGRFPLWKGIVAGFSSGVMGQAIASPTDLVKVQMQADGKRVAAGHAPRYTGIGNAFATIYRQGGVSGLWKGVIPNCQRWGLNIELCRWW